MKQVAFYEKADDELLQFAVIAAKYQGRWVLCKHKERSTWEFPGGHREAGETIEAAAVRELTEAGQSVRVQPGTEGTARCRRAMKMKNGRPVLLEADD